LLWHLRDVSNAAMARKVGRVLEMERPDWVSTHNLAGLSVAVWKEVKRRGIGLGHVLHDYYLLCPRSTMFKDERNCWRQCRSCQWLSEPKLKASRVVDLAIGISEHVLQEHTSRAYFPRSRLAVIQNARNWSGSAAERAFGGPATPLRIGYIGRLEPSKGIEVLLRAVSQLPPDRWSLRVAGRAPHPAYASELRTRFPSREIEFVGHVRPLDFYASLDVLVVPSMWNEPLGMVVVESLQFGVPVIASHAGGIPEILSSSGAGWLFETGNAPSLREILRPLLDDREVLRAKSRLALQRRKFFVPERQANEFLEAIAGALAPQAAAQSLPASSAW
jgi:glycosyltransferase involved in cell wall biosynthesis